MRMSLEKSIALEFRNGLSVRAIAKKHNLYPSVVEMILRCYL